MLSPGILSNAHLPYSGPFWLPGGDLQTIVPALWMRKPTVHYRRERWHTPDGDFIDLDWLADASSDDARDTLPSGSPAGKPSARPLLVLFHGLEGNSDSHYARSTMAAARARGWRAVIPHFRSCSGEINHAPRFYHSGDAAEIDWILQRLKAGLPADAPLFVAGVSLGGNALLRWLGENPLTSTRVVQAAAAVSAPVDLAAGGHALGTGFNRVYTRNFLQTLKVKSASKLKQFPGLFDAQAMLSATTLHSFDNIVTAPLHGYRDADDYWQRASAKPILHAIDVPTLLLNARNDPFLPAKALPGPHDVSAAITLEQPATGGHVGFAASAAWRRRAAPVAQGWLADRLLSFFSTHGGR